MKEVKSNMQSKIKDQCRMGSNDFFLNI